MKGVQSNITVLMIMSRVSFYYDVSIDDMYSKKSTKPVTLARRVAIYLIHQILNMGYAEIFVLFGVTKTGGHGVKRWMYEEQLHNSNNARIAAKIENELTEN